MKFGSSLKFRRWLNDLIGGLYLSHFTKKINMYCLSSLIIVKRTSRDWLKYERACDSFTSISFDFPYNIPWISFNSVIGGGLSLFSGHLLSLSVSISNRILFRGISRQSSSTITYSIIADGDQSHNLNYTNLGHESLGSMPDRPYVIEITYAR